MENKITAALITEVKHRLYDECLVRIRTCLDKLNDSQVWWRPNESSNSIGNLLLHLNGNIRQWILTGIGGFEDDRKRQQEFDERDPVSKEQLWSVLNATMQQVVPVIERVTSEELLKRRAVQTFDETGLTILIHVTEHFSYHTGQIAWITKMLTAQSLDFYKDVKLE